MKILGRIGNKFDIQTYQDLPLYIQNEILSSGEVLYFSDYTEIFNTFMKTIREFENDIKNITVSDSIPAGFTLATGSPDIT